MKDNRSNKSFVKFLVVWAGQLFSSLGNGMTAFALGVYVYQKTQSASGFAMVILCLFLPSILLRPLGGVMADRFDRRLMIVLGDIGSAAGVLFILASLLSGNLELWKIYLGVTVSSAFTALQSPAYKASVTDLLTEDQYSRGSGLVQLASSSQHLLSPVMAGLLLSISSLETILIIDMSTFFIAVAAVLIVKKHLPRRQTAGTERQNIFEDFREGWNSFTAGRGVLFLVGIISIITIFIGFLQTLFGPMVLSFTDPRTLGISQSAGACGMLLSSLMLGIIAVRKKHTDVFITGLFIAGMSIIILGLIENIFIITGALFLFFSSLPFINTSADVLIRKNIPNEKQGRVWGIIGVLSQIGFIAAYITAGFLADHVFNPLMAESGSLASSAGVILGTGPGRGIGLMFFISGLCVITIAWISSQIKSLRSLEL